MPDLVSRFADNAYWLARYMERAENLARILEINKVFARNAFGESEWGQVPELYSDTERFRELYEDTDEVSVLSFYVLDEENPTSIRSNIATARQNARAIRHLISTEMWTHLNIFHNQAQALTRRDISPNNISKLCGAVVRSCQAFEGVAEGTFLRGEAWLFYQLGKHVERADQATRILDIGYGRLSLDPTDAMGSVYWNALLRSVSAYHAYRHRYPSDSTPEDIARFLLYDREFPRAAALCVDEITVHLRALERRHKQRRRESVEDARRSLEFLLETGLDMKLTPARLHKFVDKLQASLVKLSGAIGQTYFH